MRPSAESEEPASADHLRDASLSMESATSLAARLLPAILVVGLVPHLLIWGWDSIARGFVTVFTLRYFIPGLILTVIVHEGLHAAGFRLFGLVPHSAIHFGFDRKTLSPFAGCRMPMSARAYRGAVLLPAIVLGALPLVAGWASGIGWLAVLGTLQLITAAGDLVAFRAFHDVPGTAQVIDHPERVGCRVIDG